MAQANADPDTLEEFARDLNIYLEELNALTKGIQQRFALLSETWRDQDQQRFADEFDHLTVNLERFCTAAEPMIPHLRKKAAHLRGYFGE